MKKVNFILLVIAVIGIIFTFWLFNKEVML